MPVTEYYQCTHHHEPEADTVKQPLYLSRLTVNKEAPAAWLYALAEARAGEGSYYAAATAYGRLIDACYPDPHLILKRAAMLIKAGDSDAAKDDMQRYLAIDPDNTGALGLMGKTYAEEGAIYEALPYLNANIEKHPGEAEAFSLRGDAWLAARTWEKAAEDYTMSLDLDPENADVNLNMGLSLINSGKAETPAITSARPRNWEKRMQQSTCANTVSNKASGSRGHDHLPYMSSQSCHTGLSA